MTKHPINNQAYSNRNSNRNRNLMKSPSKYTTSTIKRYWVISKHRKMDKSSTLESSGIQN